MCGIAGILSYDGPVDAVALRRMTAALRHRGPDDEGFHIEEAAERGPRIGLGFRRLSIIDLDGGHQPMCNEDGSVWVILNGEIYNFAALRAELEARGHTFRTRSDTETLVHLWEEHGTDCVDKLNGMFAFALWDARRRALFLARDRMGKKPLYWVDTGRSLLFASELKGLLQHPDCPRNIDRRALAKYLAYEYVPSPWCIFESVHKLPAAHTLLWESGRTDVRRYWDMHFTGSQNGSGNGARRHEADYAAELRDRLREAVRLRLVSDVPLGVFLSGGIDSSSIVAMMAELMPPASIKTFSIGFEDRSFDESSHARRVAQFFGTDHREEVLRPDTMVDILPEVAGFLDEPFADASIVPTYLLSRFTRQHVTVALGGDGGDELLAGYPTFQAARAARFYRVPRLLHERILQPLAERLPVSHDNFSLDFKLKRFLRGVMHRPGVRNQVWLGAFDPIGQAEILGGDPTADAHGATGRAYDVYDDIARAEAECPSSNPLERLIYLYCRFYLQDDILVKVDRASMACSLEVRAPFLDYTLVEFLNGIPPDLKLRGMQTKYILKRAMSSRLPPGIAGRGKKGFGIPVAKWFRSELRELAGDVLSESRIRRQGILDWPVVARLLDEHWNGVRDNRKQLWTLFVFQLWFDRFTGRPLASPARAGA